MDSNYTPIIKQEFLNENETVATVLSDADINIPVKNEPILEEDTSLVTIKYETLLDSSYASILNIKNENQLETQSAAVDGFVIYELETPQNGKQTTYTNVPSINNSNLSLNLNDREHCDKINLETAQYTQLNNAVSPMSPTSIPILLNTQLRKRNKIVFPVSSLDKRTRYNIEGTLTKNRNSQISSSSETSSVSPTTHTSSKKIINHLIKHKHVQRKQEIKINEKNIKRDLVKLISTKSSQFTSNDLVKPTPDSSHRNTTSIPKSIEDNETKVEYIKCQIENPTTMITLQDKILTKSDLTHSTKKSKAATIACELRVKCLCRLTVGSSQTTDTDKSELIDFFKEMFEKTRHLTKKQQRDVKMTLLQSISEAENAVEQGKCCCF